MVINIGKTKFMVVNGSQEDKTPIAADDIHVKNCDSCTYLDAAFTQDGSPSTSVREHLTNKRGMS